MRCSLLTAGLVLATTSGCGGSDKDSAAPTGRWLMSAQDLGTPLAAGPDADLSAASDLWFVAEQLLPGLIWDDPSVDIPLFTFDTIAMDIGVADSGSCPYEQIDTTSTTWRSDCRSTHGYEWTGRLVRERWEEGSVTYTRWDSDLVIEGDIDDPEFERLSVQGAWVYASGDGGELVTGIQANVAVSLEGYWVRANAADPREAAWRDWAWTGHEELRADGTRIVDGTGRLGAFGTVDITTDSLTVTTACDTSPTGTVTMTGAQTVTLGFHGETDCRRCADLSGDVSGTTEVCGS